MDKITVVCHKDHVVGYEDYAGKCLLCEVERLQNRDWVGLTEGEFRAIGQRFENDNGHVQAWMSFARHIQFALKEKNT